MAYRKVYFRIHTEGYVSGWSSDSDKAAFKEESRRLFKSLGWTLTLGHNGCCDTVTKGQGEIILTDIEPGTYLAIERDTGDAGHILDASYQEVVKTIRGLGGIAVTSTQGMQDLFGLDGGKYGKGILDSSRIKLVMQMENRRHGSFKECSICLRMKSDRSPDSAGGRGYSVLGITMSLSNSTPPKKSTTPTLEVPEPHIQKCETGSSRSAGIALPEVPKLHPSQKEKSYTDPIHTETSPSVGQAAGRTDAEPPGETIVLGMSEQEQLARILENCELWIFDPETAKVFANAIERLFYSDSFRIGKAVLPQANVRSRLWDLDAIILQSVEGKLRSNQRDVRNSTAYTMAVIFNTICEAHSDVLVDPYLNGTGGSPEPR